VCVNVRLGNYNFILFPNNWECKLLKYITLYYIFRMPNKEELDYIENSYASTLIKFFLDQGFDVDRSIRRGMEEFIEELLDEIIRLEGG